jgi:predicted  nucleic acid-binding Zn-ribbon protein
MQIYNARKGVACSEILDNNCEGCGAYIPPQLVNEALSKEIVNCGTCSRFLYKSENNQKINFFLLNSISIPYYISKS